MNDNCLEKGITDEAAEICDRGEHWRKSTFSMNGDCVEVASLTANYVGVRDSKATAGRYLRFSSDIWTGFIKSIQA
jgi:hypothetical protein